MQFFDDYRLICQTISANQARFGLLPLAYYVLLLEDRRFYHHPGFDVLSIGRALLKNLRGMRGGGASTIEQQLVRTITNRRERTITRKLREIMLAAIITQRFSKDAILDAYLQYAYFGTGLIGCERAALRLFHCSPHLLQGFQAAFLAGLLLYPAPRMTSLKWLHKASRRALYALRLEAKFARSTHLENLERKFKPTRLLERASVFSRTSP